MKTIKYSTAAVLLLETFPKRLTITETFNKIINSRFFKIRMAFLLSIALLTQMTVAQPSVINYGFYNIKGKVSNANKKFWEFTQTGYLKNISCKVQLNDNGTFDKTFPVNGMQDLYLSINNNPITIYVQSGDTIEINWDVQNPDKSLKIISHSLTRNKDLQLNLRLSKEFKNPVLLLSQDLAKMRGGPDSVKYKLINDQYNQQLKVILDDTLQFTNLTRKFVNQVYFFYANLLLNNNLMSDVTLRKPYILLVDQKKVNPNNSPMIRKYLPGDHQFENLSEKDFNECPEYRTYLDNYTRSPQALFRKDKAVQSSLTFAEIFKLSPNLRAYKLGSEFLYIPQIRDWFITKSILSSFEQYPFDDSEKIYNDFLPKCQTQSWKDSLTTFYDSFKKYKSGTPAPQFSLLDEKGRKVSLTDFKGKAVFIDFWGVGCAPCRSEIANYVPKLHKKYLGKDIVFINICVDVNETIWKKTLSEIKLDGINLIAEGWENNQVCKDYNITGLPHYILLDKQGRFVNNFMARPSQIVSGQNVELDKLLLINQ